MANNAYRNLIANSIEGITSFRNYISNAYGRMNVNGWATYADAAQSTPVNGTGGSPSITFGINISSPLRFESDFKITKGSSDEQGEGISYDFTIDSADINKKLAILFDYSVSANFVTGTDSDIQIFIYDVTNSQLIPLDRQSLLISQGQYLSTFQASSSTSYRLIFHIATTNASAWTMQFTGVTIGESKALIGSPNGPVMTDWELTEGFEVASGFGAVTDINIWTRRVGDSLQARGYFIPVSLDAAPVILQLPNSMQIDANKYTSVTNGQSVGISYSITSGGAVDNWTNGFDEILFIDGTITNQIFFASNSNASEFVKRNASSSYAAQPGVVNVEFTVAIQGWSTNTAIADSGILVMSQVLANGTRVTGAPPTALGEYRTLIQSASSLAYDTATDTAPSDAPSATNGMRIFAKGFTSAGDAGNPTFFEIFIGKNKSYQFQKFALTGKTGELSGQGTGDGSSSIGVFDSYDPKTGLLLITTSTLFTNNRYVGIPKDGTPVTDCYFDVIVADNDFQIQLQDNQPVVFKISNSGNYSYSTTTPVELDTVEFDTYSSYDISTGIYTAPFSGYYLITTSGFNADVGQYCGVYVNNSWTEFLSRSSSGDDVESGTAVVYLNADDELTIQFDGNGTWNAVAGLYKPNWSVNKI